MTNKKKMGYLETAFENVKSGRAYEKSKIENRERLNQLSKNCDQLRSDIDDYIVRNGYVHHFSK